METKILTTYLQGNVRESLGECYNTSQLIFGIKSKQKRENERERERRERERERGGGKMSINSTASPSWGPLNAKEHAYRVSAGP